MHGLVLPARMGRVQGEREVSGSGSPPGGGGASTRYAGAAADPFGDVEEDDGASGNPGLSDLSHTAAAAASSDPASVKHPPPPPFFLPAGNWARVTSAESLARGSCGSPAATAQQAVP